MLETWPSYGDVVIIYWERSVQLVYHTAKFSRGNPFRTEGRTMSLVLAIHEHWASGYSE